MLIIKTQEVGEIVLNIRHIYTKKQCSEEYGVIAEDAHSKEKYTLGIYSTFERANEEVERIMDFMEMPKRKNIIYRMSVEKLI